MVPVNRSKEGFKTIKTLKVFKRLLKTYFFNWSVKSTVLYNNTGHFLVLILSEDRPKTIPLPPPWSVSPPGPQV